MAKAAKSVTQGAGETGRARGPGFEAKRMEILRGAALLFAENGYHETSVNVLSETLGVSKPVIYYYAKNKDDLLLQICGICREELQGALDRAKITPLSGVGKLRYFFMAYVEVMCSDLGRCYSLVGREARDPDARDDEAVGRRRIEGAVRDFILEGQEDGSISRCSPDLATRALFGAFNAIPRWFREGGAFSAQEVAAAYLDLFITGMGRG